MANKKSIVEESTDTIDDDMEYAEAKDNERHDEMIEALDAVTAAIKNQNISSTVSASLSFAISKVELAVSKINNLPSPQVSVNVDNKILTEAIATNNSGILKVKELLSDIKELYIINQNAQWEFRVQHGSDGRVEKVIGNRSIKK